MTPMMIVMLVMLSSHAAAEEALPAIAQRTPAHFNFPCASIRSII